MFSERPGSPVDRPRPPRSEPMRLSGSSATRRASAQREQIIHYTISTQLKSGWPGLLQRRRSAVVDVALIRCHRSSLLATLRPSSSSSSAWQVQRLSDKNSICQRELYLSAGLIRLPLSRIIWERTRRRKPPGSTWYSRRVRRSDEERGRWATGRGRWNGGSQQRQRQRGRRAGVRRRARDGVNAGMLWRHHGRTGRSSSPGKHHLCCYRSLFIGV